MLMRVGCGREQEEKERWGMTETIVSVVRREDGMIVARAQHTCCLAGPQEGVVARSAGARKRVGRWGSPQATQHVLMR